MLDNANATSRPRRLMTGPYLARNPAVLGMMAAGDVAGLLLPRRAQPLPAGRPLNILVTNLAHLGDLLVTLPLLARLRASPRVARLGLLIGGWGRPVLELGELADQVHCFDHWRLNRAPEGMKAKLVRHAHTRSAAVAELRRTAYDVAIDTYAYFGNSADVLWSARIPARVGFTSGGAGTLYTHRIAFEPELSLAANQARLLAPILGEAEAHITHANALPGFRADPEAERLASQLGRYIVFHVGPGLPHRDWPAANWISLGRRLQAEGFRLAFTGAGGERGHVGPIQAALGGEDLLGRFGLTGFATVLDRAQGLVSIDTMAGHLAALFQTPNAVVFPGVIPASLWGPNQPFARTVTEPVACSPCHRTMGCAAMTCLRGVSPDAVHAALRNAIAAKARAASVRPQRDLVAAP